PYGWHDTDGQEGPEYQTTRGNNVHAYQDGNGNNSSAGDEPDGGPGLVFDFPLDLAQEPETHREASVTQLFYTNNFMHDLAYAYGFDEPAGNFQQNNYGNGGAAGDYVAAEAQDGSALNNANFSTPPDGFPPRMQMYRWNSPGAVFSVTAPEAIAGFYEVRPALFGGSITSALLAGPVVEYNGGTGLPALACSPAQNAAQLNGSVALIDRGTCDFDRKALNAQNAGAVAAIICNYADDLVNMGPVSVGGQVNIPVVSMRFSNCQTLRQFLAQGVEVAFQLPDDTGPARLDGSLDNVVVAHEYTHGISNRLAGGPSSTSCLANDEQMGEGWSDFFSMAATVKPGDTGATPRTYANYVLRQGAGGTGLRRQPYSTDMAVNNQTYEDIVGTTIEQSLGEVWAVVLWDLYWKLAEVYGWDEDPVNGSSGNNLAMQLVVDALKLQACSPGFIDGRDALLAADAMNSGGANACYIWEVFARRGLGFAAEQGSRFNRNDGLADFRVLPECVKELKIAKTATPLIDAGEALTVTLTITNHKETAVTEVVVSDEIPAEAVYVAGSATGGVPEVAGGEIRFSIGALASGEERVLSYQLNTSSGIISIRQFLDDMESGQENWMTDNLNPAGFDFWNYSDNDANSGNYSWYIRNTASANDQVLQLKAPIAVTGAQPTLRFYHRFETEAGLDGGFVEVSANGGASWEPIEELIARSPYPRPLASSTLAIPSLRAYSGSSDGEWLDTYADLSPYLGEELLVRFRFGSNGSGAPNAFNPGWYVDDVEFMDRVNYNGEACVSSGEGDLACARAPYLGTVVESAVVSGTKTPPPELAVELFPNPVRDVLNIMLQPGQPNRISVSLSGPDGRLVLERQAGATGGYQLLPLDVSGLAPGFYVVRVSVGGQAWSGKMVKE
ncbi:MAG: M36 family metallopeptidase, partial [Phaeodactylibacter sp.]|nr:M36 family metallopeptidase [Phaeodactylibacter sp.]